LADKDSADIKSDKIDGMDNDKIVELEEIIWTR